LSIQLRYYQQDALEKIGQALKKFRSVCYQAPTGAGKTTVFASICKGGYELGNRITIVVHRQELIDQISDRLNQFDVPHGIISPHYPKTNDRIQIASIFTLVRRLDEYEIPDLYIIDEAHHAVAGSWRKIIDAHPMSSVLGVTATPQRLDGSGLNQVFDYLILGPSIKQLIVDGYLVQPLVYAPAGKINLTGVHTRAGDYVKEELAEMVDKPSITGNAIEHYKRICANVPAIAFCVSVKHAKNVAEQFNSAGVTAKSIDGTMNPYERRSIVNSLRSGSIQLLTSCDLVSEGFDLPKLECAILLRPTKSLTLYLQQVGRVLRADNGKSCAYVLDHVGNCFTHGLPENEREWSLDGREKNQREPVLSLKQCKECYAVFSAHKQICPQCGTQSIGKPRHIEEEEGELELVKEDLKLREFQKKQIWKRVWGAKTIEDLLVIASEQNYEPGWARFMWNLKQKRKKKRA
jgi:superfamily II DNA or RNA helicase